MGGCCSRARPRANAPPSAPPVAPPGPADTAAAPARGPPGDGAHAHEEAEAEAHGGDLEAPAAREPRPEAEAEAHGGDLEAPAARGAAPALPPPAPTPPPRLVRGFSGCEQENGQLAALAARALPGWAAVAPARVRVEARSCEGVASVHRLSAEGAEPARVALHIWGEDSDDLLQRRTAAAAELMAAAGLAPPRLAHGGDWFLEPWVGSGEPALTEELPATLGALVAQVHSIPTDWYEPFRAPLCARMPALGSLPLGSHGWSWSAREYLLADLTSTCRGAWLGAECFAPRSALAARIVTAHGDCHRGNMLQTSSGVLLIDFEWSCVMCAAQDLAFVIRTCCEDSLPRKRAFIHAYSRACGASLTEQEVDDALFDCEVFSLSTHCGGPLELWEAHDDPDKWLADFRKFEAFVLSARESPALRSRVLEVGIEQYVAELEWHLREGSPVFVCAPHDAVHERLALGEDGAIFPEARRDLALGAGAGGQVVLVRRDDERRRFTFAEGARGPAELRLLPGGGHQGRGLAPAQAEPGRQVGPGPGLPPSGLVQRLELSPAGLALAVSPAGPRLMCGGGRLLRAGDPAEELARSLGLELLRRAAQGDAAACAALLAQGADANFAGEDSAGRTAARVGSASVLEVLLAHGLDVNAAVVPGSPLIEAATYGHVECVQRLLAVPGIQLFTTEEGKTASEWARDPAPHSERGGAHGQIAELLEAAERATVFGSIRRRLRNLVAG